MKFVAIAALIATTQAQTVCTDEDYGEVCPDGACCGYLQPAEGEETRACSTEDQSAADGYEGADVFSCDDPPDDDEEGASKIVLGASALLAAFYMVWASWLKMKLKK